MALLPVQLRRLRNSGFTEEQTNVLEETGEATVEAAREGLAEERRVENQFSELRGGMQELRNEMRQMRADMNAMKWWLFGGLSTLILAATAAIIAAIAFWG